MEVNQNQLQRRAQQNTEKPYFCLFVVISLTIKMQISNTKGL
jgi:hypothetical protein